MSQGRTEIHFTLNGRRHVLSLQTVEARLAGVAAEPVRKHAVLVGGTWYPAIQAFEVATGVPRREFISHTARRHLASLGLEVAGEIEPNSPKVGSARRRPAAPHSGGATDGRPGEWYSETNVQGLVVAGLARDGWRIVSVADTQARERGVDIVADRDGETVGIEVKGFPSRHYADPARAGNSKPTAPSTQAGHWYAQAVLAAMRLRTRTPTWRSVIALPDFPRYRSLHDETAGSLVAAQIEVWWVGETGLM